MIELLVIDTKCSIFERVFVVVTFLWKLSDMKCLTRIKIDLEKQIREGK